MRGFRNAIRKLHIAAAAVRVCEADVGGAGVAAVFGVLVFLEAKAEQENCGDAYEH